MDLKAIMMGGVLPSILLGTSTVLMKFSFKKGISLSAYITVVGGTVLLYGLTAMLINGKGALNAVSTTYAVGMGVLWSSAMLCICYGFSVLRLPVALVAPLTNSNALVAVLLSALLLSEWKDLNFYKVIMGTVLIVMGASIVSTAIASE